MPGKIKPKKTAKESSGPITGDMVLGDAVQKYPDTAEVMFRHGLHCIGCHVSAYETIEQGAMAHGIDVDKLLDDMNKAVRKKGSKK